MPRIKKQLYKRTETYLQAFAVSEQLREQNDCAPRAVWIATNMEVPYETVLKMFGEEGRKPGRGCFKDQQRRVIERLGYGVVNEIFCSQHLRGQERKFIDRYPGSHVKLKSITTHHMDRFPGVWQDGNTYLIYTKGHVGCCKNGVLHDFTRGTALRVRSIWQIIKKQSQESNNV